MELIGTFRRLQPLPTIVMHNDTTCHEALLKVIEECIDADERFQNMPWCRASDILRARMKERPLQLSDMHKCDHTNHGWQRRREERASGVRTVSREVVADAREYERVYGS